MANSKDDNNFRITRQASIQWLGDHAGYETPAVDNMLSNKTYKVAKKKSLYQHITHEVMGARTLGEVTQSKKYLARMLRERPRIGQSPDSEAKLIKDLSRFGTLQLKEALSTKNQVPAQAAGISGDRATLMSLGYGKDLSSCIKTSGLTMIKNTIEAKREFREQVKH